MPYQNDQSPTVSRDVTIFQRGARLHAHLSIPEHPQALVILANATGRGRANPRNRKLAETLNRASIATLLADLLTSEEEVIAELTGDYRRDVPLQCSRLLAFTEWGAAQPELHRLPVGYLATGTAGAAAIIAAVERPQRVHAIVTRSGRADLAWDYLPRCGTPTLMIVGERDTPMRAMNWVALQRLGATVKDVEILAGAGHLFLEPGALEAMGAAAANWFIEHLGVLDPLRERELAAV